MPDFDTAWKEALEALFEPFMAFFFPEAHRDIDWSRPCEMLDKELQEITRESEHRRRVVDKLVKVWRTNGQDEWVLVHIEVQSQADAEFARRMYVYNYRLFDRYNRNVASFAILGDDRAGWRPQRFGYELWGTKAGIEFATAKLLDCAADGAALEANPNPFAVVVLAHLKAQEHGHDDDARRATEVRLVKGLYERGFTAERIRQLYRLIDGMMSLPKALAALAWKEIQDFEKEKEMPFLTGADIVGREEGLAEGLAKGLAQGRAEARETVLESIEAVLEVKVGPAGLALLPEIRQIDDLQLLREIFQAAKRGESPEVIRRLWMKA